MAFTKTAEDFLITDLYKEAGILDSLAKFTTRAGSSGLAAAAQSKATTSPAIIC